MPHRPTVSLILDLGRGDPPRILRWRRTRLVAGLVLGAVVVGLLAGSWILFAVRARHAASMQDELERLRGDRARVAALAESLSGVEEEYQRLRELFGPEVVPGRGASWLPPPSGRPTRGVAGDDTDGSLPTTWPLTTSGFLTQGVLDSPEGEHPGIDIAVPSGAYIRVAGPGVVVESGEDALYGLYLVVDHGDGYRTRYAHASRLLARAGDELLRGEVIGLTGTTGRSTAPHLHFEIILDGEPVDPLGLVRRP